MSITALPSTMSAVPPTRTPQASEAPGRDHDGDADNQGVANSAPPSAALPKGLGVAVDTKG